MLHAVWQQITSVCSAAQDIAYHLPIAATVGIIQELVLLLYKILLFTIGSQLTVGCCLVKDMSDWVSVLMHVITYSDNAFRKVDSQWMCRSKSCASNIRWCCTIVLLAYCFLKESGLFNSNILVICIWISPVIIWCICRKAVVSLRMLWCYLHLSHVTIYKKHQRKLTFIYNMTFHFGFAVGRGT
jgi:hypothetical protein